MHQYRSHNCNELTHKNANEQVKLSGWVNRMRDHGGLVFLDLRDNFGITQCVIDTEDELFKQVEQTSNESVITISGTVVLRSNDTINSNLPTGKIEIKITAFEIQSKSASLPFPVNQQSGYPEDIRLKYRFLDLRSDKMHKNILLRSKVISSLRQRMVDQGFCEHQTPILTASSPEGARDFLVPSRTHPGKFYALPQAPQQFKQLLMVAGFDRYFQIAPCFRDEDARADRSPGEFYQLDFEMSFVTQQDVFDVLEQVLYGVFVEFAEGRKVTPPPFKQITYKDAMLNYGCDKPDLRNPILIKDVTEVFKGSDFKIFANLIEKGFVVRAIPAPLASLKPRSFFDKLNHWARGEGQAGLGYIQFKQDGAFGPIAKNLSDDKIAELKEICSINDGDSIFFACAKKQEVTQFSASVRTKLAIELDLIDDSEFNFCWVVDFPMFEFDEKQDKIDFSHNPFSMPQGGIEALNTKDPLDILAYQYDIVCNGIELSSGALRNHLPEVMYKAFSICGYDKQFVDDKFYGMINAFKYGAPPHGGAAPGIERIVMLLAGEPNIRQISAFPLNQNGQDLMMRAPNIVSKQALKDIHIGLKLPPTIEKPDTD